MSRRHQLDEWAGQRANEELGKLSEIAYARVREMLATGEITRRTAIREAELVRRLGMSRTPVREALFRLETEGLIKPARSGGYVAVELDPADISDVFEVHSAIELLSARLAARRHTRVNIAQLEEVLDEADEAVSQGDLARCGRCSTKFHELVGEATQNSYLQEVLANVHEVYGRFWLEPVFDAKDWAEDFAESRALLEAIRVRDEAGAEEIMNAKMQRFLSLRLRALAAQRESGSAEPAAPQPAAIPSGEPAT